MQFNSYLFIMLYLPLFIIGYFLTYRRNDRAGKTFIIVAGAIFYLYGGIYISLIFVFSILFNYIASVMIIKNRTRKKLILGMAVAANIALLFYFKYFNFAIITISGLLHKEYATKNLLLPLGISFFTFQQIMFIGSIYRGDLDTADLVDYLAYILYFPKLIMGPLVEPKELLDQINDRRNKTIRWENIAAGLKIFSFGLFKKMVIADTFSRAVSWGFENMLQTTSGDIFLVMLFYTFEIYFDFSGYTDMAIGISNMVNITLPMNFNSPYKATSIRDFWKRWHMSLTGFLTKYVYFPLGGSRKGPLRTYVNILIVFLVSGLWHGANWTFILWGLLHGSLQIAERLFQNAYDKLHEVVKWTYTFLSVNILWLLFRSESIQQWKSLLVRMLTFKNMAISDGLINSFDMPECSFFYDIFHLTSVNSAVRGFSMSIFIMAAFLICLVPENNYKTLHKTTWFNVVVCAVAFVWAFLCLSSESVFVYFNF